MLNLSTKERMHLEDQQSHEELCVNKYQTYANEAQDPVLKELFLNHATAEYEHYNTLNQLLNGQIPNMNAGSQMQNSNNQSQNNSNMNITTNMYNQNDIALCKDLLMTEKYVSTTYNNAIFASSNPAIRQILNHIQKDEQHHGEDILNYLESKGISNPE